MIDDSQDFRTFYFEIGRKGRSHLKIPKGLPFHLCRPGDQHRVLFEALVPCRTIRFPWGAAQCHTAAAVSTGPGIHTGVGCRGAWQREGASERQWKNEKICFKKSGIPITCIQSFIRVFPDLHLVFLPFFRSWRPFHVRELTWTPEMLQALIFIRFVALATCLRSKLISRCRLLQVGIIRNPGGWNLLKPFWNPYFCCTCHAYDLIMAALGLDLRLHPGVGFFRVQGRQAWQDWKGLRVSVVPVVPVVRCVQSSTVSVSRMRRGWGWGWSLSKVSIVGGADSTSEWQAHSQCQFPFKFCRKGGLGDVILDLNPVFTQSCQDTGHAFQWYARSPQRGWVQNSEPCLCMSNGGQLKGCFSRLKQRSMWATVGSVFKFVHQQATMFCGRG